MTPNALAFRERQAFWQRQGLSGIEILRAMQSDSALPAFLAPDDLEDIEGLKPVTLPMRRQRQIGPPYIKASARQVLYPVCDYIEWLCDRFFSQPARAANTRVVNGDKADISHTDNHTPTGEAVKTKRPKQRRATQQQQSAEHSS